MTTTAHAPAQRLAPVLAHSAEAHHLNADVTNGPARVRAHPCHALAVAAAHRRARTAAVDRLRLPDREAVIAEEETDAGKIFIFLCRFSFQSYLLPSFSLFHAEGGGRLCGPLFGRIFSIVFVDHALGFL